MTERIYYADQDDWQPIDYQGLWRYLNRLFLTIGPTEAALARPDELFARIQSRRFGTRDEELSAIDLGSASPETRYLMKHMLINMGRYDLALEKFPNLRPLDEVGELGHPLVLDERPTHAHPYYTQVGILL